MLSQSAFAPAVMEAKLAAAPVAAPASREPAPEAPAACSSRGGALVPHTRMDPAALPHPPAFTHDQHSQQDHHSHHHHHHHHHQRRCHTVCQPMLPEEALAAINLARSTGHLARSVADLAASFQRAYSATGTELGPQGSEPEPHHLFNHHLHRLTATSGGGGTAAAAVAASRRGPEMSSAAAAAAANAAAGMAAAAKAAAAAAAAAAVHRRGGGWELERVACESMPRSRSCELLQHLGAVEEDADAAAWWT
ncbi:hypothetical protein HYH02_000081 [Chlamydomonas schloesseri]|uniref:Uncharacterized protein n=1 Tax=Chlamydomonas schloesseri TaxID=2026947 RepID=A0A836B7H9_9CHLO|nr:hypothetical protein HYH02_000081 [Chlamydomonas schloesseri]|eukprot:KAG2449977.1 hypothetical protein HYH02_000081 [Chlamydomonas schloesseri]